VVDDLSDKEALSRVNNAPRDEALMGSMNPDDDSDSGVRAGASPKEDNGPDGSQYSGDSQEEDSYVDEYDGYILPSDEDESEYMRIMIDFDQYKEHAIAAETHDPDTIAWKTRDRYEQDLVTLGWILALENPNFPEGPEKDARAALGAKIDALMIDVQKLTLQLEASQRSRDEAHKRNKEIHEELKAAQGSQLPEARQEEGPSLESRIGALERRNRDLTVRLETSQRLRDNVVRQFEDLQEELEYAQLSSSLYQGEAEFWKEQHDSRMPNELTTQG
ncbi:hypothetical protein BC826DRAFT_975107, partial [Russula brevipes]